MYTPVVGRAGTLSRYRPLSDYLAATLQIPVVPTSFEDYSEMALPLAKKEFEIADLSPAAYMKASAYPGLEVLAMEIDRAGNRGYRAVIICRADHNYLRAPDARGQVLAFTNSTSTSGFLVPLMYFLRDLRETPAVFAKKVVFAGNHEDVVKGVYAGEYDLGATNDMDMNRTIQAENIPASSLRVIWQSPSLIPGAVICAREDLPPSFKAALYQALLRFNQDPAGLSALQIGGFARATAQDYEVLRELSPLSE